MRAVVALDGSELDHDIAAAAAFVLHAGRDRVSLLMVVSPGELDETPVGTGGGSFVPTPQSTASGVPLPSTETPTPTAEGRDQAVARVRTERSAYLNSIGAQHLGDLPYEAHVEIADDPAEAIVRFVAEQGIEGLAMGTRTGRGRLGSALFGSVSETVIRRTNVPVLVVKRGGAAGDAG